MPTPISTIEFHITETNTLFLLSLVDIDALKVYLNNLKNVLVIPNSTILIVRRFSHLFLLWDTTLHAFIQDSLSENLCYLTDSKLQRLHQRFGYPLVGWLNVVLIRASYNINKKALEHLTKFCEYYQKHGKSLSKFKFTI